MRRFMIGILTILCIILIVYFTHGQSIPDVISKLMSPQQQKQCGLHKLTSSEMENLNSFLLRAVLSRSNDLGDSAIAYLENEGWEEVNVLGTQELKLNGNYYTEEYVIAEKGVWTYILEPKTYSNLKPGRYLGQMGYVSCEIIDTDGDVVRFWTKDTR